MKSFAAAVLQWGDQHGRETLPWQQEKSAYRVWVSEIMLQQTRVETVISYFDNFMRTFPDVCALAAAPQDQVLGLWSGLGYYARARNLHRAAQILCDEHGGEMPDHRTAVEALPGIGRSTAAAILSIAYGLPEAILDGNVKRVLCRYHGVEGWPGKSVVMRTLWSHAEQHMPSARCGAYTQYMMDLGATLCTRSQPRCEQCPLQRNCIAKQEGRNDELPHPKPGKKLPQRKSQLLILDNGKGALWMERRPEQGIWGGLWSFPETEAITGLQQWPLLNHTFTHFKLEITPFYGMDCDHSVPEVGEWVTRAEMAERGIPAPIQRLVDHWDHL